MCVGQIVGELRDQQSSLGRGKGWEERVTQETRAKVKLEGDRMC